MNNRKNKAIRLSLLTLVCDGVCLTVVAQSTTGSISGTVKDSAGAAIGGAEVTLSKLAGHAAYGAHRR